MAMTTLQIDQSPLAIADAEERRLGHSVLAPEHLLVAAATMASGPVREFCNRHGLTPDRLRNEVVRLYGSLPRSELDPTRPLALALRSQVALAHALHAGMIRGDPQSTTDELLAALCEDDVAERGVVGAILKGAEVSPRSARAELARLLSEPRAT